MYVCCLSARLARGHTDIHVYIYMARRLGRSLMPSLLIFTFLLIPSSYSFLSVEEEAYDVSMESMSIAPLERTAAAVAANTMVRKRNTGILY